MHFGENQLSRSLIGLSPLTTGHPPTFQSCWVRTSTLSHSLYSILTARPPSHAPSRREAFTYRTITVYGAASQRLRLTPRFLTARPAGRPVHRCPTTPHTQPLPGITH